MDLEETSQNNTEEFCLLALGNDLSVSVAVALNILLNFE